MTALACGVDDAMAAEEVALLSALDRVAAACGSEDRLARDGPATGWVLLLRCVCGRLVMVAFFVFLIILACFSFSWFAFLFSFPFPFHLSSPSASTSSFLFLFSFILCPPAAACLYVTYVNLTIWDGRRGTDRQALCQWDVNYRSGTFLHFRAFIIMSSSLFKEWESGPLEKGMSAWRIDMKPFKEAGFDGLW